MTMSTQTLAEASRLLAGAVLTDIVQLYDVQQPITVGINVTRELTAAGEPVPGLVQTTTLENAAESNVTNIYYVKLASKTAVRAGQVVKVLECRAEPDLVGKKLLLDKVSQNGLAMLRKAVASDFQVVNQEGKESI